MFYLEVLHLQRECTIYKIIEHAQEVNTFIGTYSEYVLEVFYKML